jgi:quinol monooxygenase YgiN
MFGLFHGLLVLNYKRFNCFSCNYFRTIIRFDYIAISGIKSEAILKEDHSKKPDSMRKSIIPYITVLILFISHPGSALHGNQTELINEENQTMTQTHPVMYGRSGALNAKPGKADELASILLEAADLVSTAKGCRLYIVSMDVNDENTIWVVEVWDSKEDHANSLQKEGVRELISKAIPLIDGQPKGGMELDVLGGWGLSQ